MFLHSAEEHVPIDLGSVAVSVPDIPTKQISQVLNQTQIGENTDYGKD